MIRTIGHWYWSFFIFIGFIAVEAAAVGSRGRFPTLSQSWHHARETWPTWASFLLQVGTMAVGVWILTIHWAWSSFDRRGWADDIAVALFGAFLGVLSWRAHRKSLGRTQGRSTAVSADPPLTEDTEM